MRKTSREKKPARTVARGKSSRAKQPSLSGSGKRSSPTWIGKIDAVTRELNLSERRIYQLAKEGLPKTAPGRYNIPECFRWYVRFMQQKLIDRAFPEKNGDGAAAAAGVIRHKMLSIESELKQIELTEKREQFVSVEKVREDIHAIVREIRRRFAELPPKIAADVVGETDLAVSQVKVDRALKGALESLSQFDPDEPVEAVEPASAARSTSRSRTQ